MIPFGNETVTLIQREKDTDGNGRTVVSYRKYTLTGCSWRRAARSYMSESNVVFQEEVTCRIPESQQRPQVGDLLICGDADVTVTSGGEFQKLIERYKGDSGAFTVAAVSDNTRSGCPLKHWAARG